MPLLQPEEIAVTDWVIGFGDQFEFDAFLQRNGGHRLSSFSAAVLPLPVISVHFVLWLNQHPEHLTAVLTAVVTEYPAHPSTPRLTEALQRLAHAAARAAAPAWMNPLPGNIPMANRAPLRSVLQDLLRCDRPVAVMVDGPKGTGRSHSWHLINHVGRSARIAPIKIDLLSPVLEQRTIETVFDLLVRKLGIPVVRPSTIGATPETVAARYADDIATALNLANQGRNWIVFDSLDRPVAPEIKKFICELTQLRLAGEFQNCNFFLLGANRDFGVSDPHFLAELEHLSRLTDREIEDAATAINGLGRTPKSGADLANWVQSCLAEVLPLDASSACIKVGDKLRQLRMEVLA
jgi:hypothetical protein